MQGEYLLKRLYYTTLVDLVENYESNTLLKGEYLPMETYARIHEQGKAEQQKHQAIHSKELATIGRTSKFEKPLGEITRTEWEKLWMQVPEKL